MELLSLVTVFFVFTLIIAISWANSHANQKAQDLLAQWRRQEIDRIQQDQQKLAEERARIMLNEWKQHSEKSIRESAIGQSRSVTTGKITEQMVPYLPGFDFDAADARFIGTPIDFIVFNGLDEGDLGDIVFVEVKSGSSRLTKRQKMVKEAVEDGRVEWREIRTDALKDTEEADGSNWLMSLES